MTNNNRKFIKDLNFTKQELFQTMEKNTLIVQI